MGHTRLGTLPATKKWKQVIGLMIEGASVAKVAEATTNAWRNAFATIKNDLGFREAVWLMTQMGIAGSSNDPVAHLSAIGVEVGGSSSPIEVAMALTEALDHRIDSAGKRSDFGEIAEKALVAVVTETMQSDMPTLLNSTADDIKATLGKLGTVKNFTDLSRNFFTRLTNDCLNYFISKTNAEPAVRPQSSTKMDQIAKFESALKTHCQETSVIVETFSGDWFSKNRYEGGGNIDRDTAEKFGGYALTKIQMELEARARANGSSKKPSLRTVFWQPCSPTHQPSALSSCSKSPIIKPNKNASRKPNRRPTLIASEKAWGITCSRSRAAAKFSPTNGERPCSTAF
jgi:hypothetical protein